MFKKVTNEDVKNVIKDTAKQIVDEFDKEIIQARCAMDYALENVTATFTSRQKKLFEEYLLAKQNYVDAVANKEKALKN